MTRTGIDPPANARHTRHDGAFTLASALEWAGHVCPGDCPPGAQQLSAGIWFLRRAGADLRFAPTVLVVVDVGTSDTDTRALLGQVNRCTRKDNMVVRAKSADDRGHARSLLTGYNSASESRRTSAESSLRLSGRSVSPVRRTYASHTCRAPR